MQGGDIMEYIGQNQLITYQQLFSIFDKEDSGIISTSDLSLYIRGLGHCPTEVELSKIISSLDPHEEGIAPFKTVVQTLVKRKKQINIQDQLIEAFEAIQNETGSSHSDSQKSYKTSVTGAKKYLAEFGEKLSQGELQYFQQFLQENNLKEGIEFNFRDLAKILAYTYIE